MTKQIKKAITIQIELGDRELNCLQLPNGDYAVAAFQILEFFGIDNVQNNASRDVKRILGKDSDNVILSVKTDIRPRALPVLNLTQVGLVALQLAFKGNKEAQAYLVACQAESLERRIDLALGVIRQEQERNERFIARRDAVLQRHYWVDTIKWYLDNHPELSDNYRKFIYPNVSDKLNKALFGKTAKQIRAELDMDKSEAVRDCINPEYLPDIQFLEKYSATRVRQGLNPYQAIDEALAFMQLEIRPLSRK